ncbi:hypothetical protein [Streptomyces sp. CAU 1734]|uniref:hypothetical protein n=1 Tax=Streptomyces sp. CAU 1734 TaxID=3140360 RepID=UPI0032605DDA
MSSDSSDQQYPYGQQPDPHGTDPYGQPDPYGQQQYHQPQQQPGPYHQPQQQPGPYHQPQAPRAYGQSGPYQYPQPSPGEYQESAQTWEGETWSTQYQPAVPAAPAPGPAVEETAHLPPVREAYPPQAHGGHRRAPVAPAPPGSLQGALPLPPEAPAPHRAAGPGTPAGPAAPEPAEGYTTPTTGGNARITDAQRARAEGRSPIIPPGIQPAVLTAGLGLLIAGGAAIGSYALLLPLVLLQAVTAAGWFRLNGMWPARQGIALAFAGGLVADGVLLTAGRENAPAAILGTLGVWVLITLVLQLRSHASPDERMQGLMATVASAALAVLAAGYFAAADAAVITGAVAVAAAVVVRALPLPGIVSVAAALAAGAGAGALAGRLADLGSGGVLLGLGAGGLALIGLRVASYDYPSRFVHFTAGVALPLTAAAPGVYLIGRMLA